MKKKCLVIIVCMLLVLSACAPAAAPAADPGAEAPLEFVFLQVHADSYILIQLARELTNQGAELGVNVTTLISGRCEATQITQVEQSIQQGVDAIIMQATQGEALMVGVNAAADAGIPILTIHEGVVDNTRVGAAVYIDLEWTGEVAMQRIIDEIGPDGYVVIVNGSMGHPSQLRIREGYQRTLDRYPNVTVQFEGTGNWNNEDAMATVEAWLGTGHRIDGIAVMNDAMAAGVRTAVANAGRTGELPIYSNNAQADSRQAIRDGEQRGTFCMFPVLQAEIALREAISLIRTGQLTQEGTGPARNEFALPAYLVTIDNIDEYEARLG